LTTKFNSLETAEQVMTGLNSSNNNNNIKLNNLQLTAQSRPTVRRNLAESQDKKLSCCTTTAGFFVHFENF